MASKVEFMTLQLKRGNEEGDVVDLVNGKPKPDLHGRPLLMALEQLANKEDWKVVSVYSSNGQPNILLTRSVEEHES